MAKFDNATIGRAMLGARWSALARTGLDLESIGRFDLPTLQGVVIFGAVAIILFSLIVDLLYAWIDPRIRLT